MSDAACLFETERLAARRLMWADLDELDRMQSSPEVMKFITGRPKTREETTAELAGIMDAYEHPERGLCVLAVTSKPDLRFVGTCAVVGGEIGYRLTPEHWGRGFGREICRGLIQYCFRELGLQCVTAEVEEDNLVSMRILESEMVFVSRMRDAATGRMVRAYQKLNPANQKA